MNTLSTEDRTMLAGIKDHLIQDATQAELEVRRNAHYLPSSQVVSDYYQREADWCRKAATLVQRIIDEEARQQDSDPVTRVPDVPCPQCGQAGLGVRHARGTLECNACTLRVRLDQAEEQDLIWMLSGRDNTPIAPYIAEIAAVKAA